MFEIGWSELMLIGIVALIVIGPKELPGVLRTVGRTVTKLRRMAGEFQGQFQEALREADLADMRKEITDITETARSSIAASPVNDIFDPMRSIREEIRTAVESATKPPGAAADAALPDAAPPEAARAPEVAQADDPFAAMRAEIRAAVSGATPAATGSGPSALDAQLPPPSDEPLPPPDFGAPHPEPLPAPSASVFSAPAPESLPQKSAS